MRLTHAVTHIPLCATNDAKVAALDSLATEYLALCQQYVTLFCAEAEPNGDADPCFPSQLSQRGNHDGSFQGKLAKRHQRDHEKRRRKAKLRSCLKQRGVERLPSTRNPQLARTVRQEINRAVNELYRDHAGSQISFERLNVAGMRFKARRMNAYLYASNLAHIPKQLACGAAKRGIRATPVNSAYTSQACPRRHFVARSNRPEQQMFCCGGCDWEAHADHTAAINIARRMEDQGLRACRSRQEGQALLNARHHQWRAETGWS
jgi:transposase